MIIIWGSYKGRRPEALDESNDPVYASELATEYRIAFGPDWHIWID